MINTKFLIILNALLLTSNLAFSQEDINKSTEIAKSLDSKDTNSMDPSKSKTFSTAKSDPIYSKSDTAMLVLGDKNALNSANIAVTALRLFDYELDVNDMKRDRENSWLMQYFEP